MRQIPLCSYAVLAVAVGFAQAGVVDAQVAGTQVADTPAQAQTPVASSPAAAAEPEQVAPEQDVQGESRVGVAGVSQVRIVRLSEARGEVRLDRNTGVKFEQAFANVPIVAGERLQTIMGVAEVEFEDNSTLRLAPDTVVEFPVLGRDASGVTVSEVRLLSGSAYVSMAGGKSASVYTLSVGSRKITLPPASHIRVDMGGVTAARAGTAVAGTAAGPGTTVGAAATAATVPATATLAVLDGSVSVVDGAGGSLTVPKKKSVTFNLNSAAAAAPPVLVAYKGGDTLLDKWDKNSASYHQVRASSSFAGASPYAYGLNDLSYYGSFANYGSCGSLWRPYLVSSSWDPYGSGVWAMYPGAGYSWVSPYPWGWTPYHSGSWEYCDGAGSGGGWGWRPGNASSWTALSNRPPVRKIGGPVRPLPVFPRAGQGTLVPVNMKGLPVSEPGAGGFTFRRDSAGMGVPRGSFENLGKVSHTVVERGVATTAVSDRAAQRGMIAASPGVAGARAGAASNGPGAGGGARSGGGAGSAVMSAGSVSSAPASGGMHGTATSGGGSSHH